MTTPQVEFENRLNRKRTYDNLLMHKIFERMDRQLAEIAEDTDETRD